MTTDLMQPLDREEAEALAASIRSSLDDAREKVIEFYRRRGWEALGYKSMKQCAAAEFGWSKSHIYKMIQAAKVVEEVGRRQLPLRSAVELAKVPEGERAAVLERAGDTSERSVRRAAREKPTWRGIELKPRTAAALAMTDVFDEMAALARRLRKKIKVTTDQSIGAFLKIEAQALDKQLATMIAVIRQSRPYAPCLPCGQRGCRLCRSTGWLPKEVYDRSVPDEIKPDETA